MNKTQVTAYLRLIFIVAAGFLLGFQYGWQTGLSAGLIVWTVMPEIEG